MLKSLQTLLLAWLTCYWKQGGKTLWREFGSPHMHACFNVQHGYISFNPILCMNEANL